MEFIVGTILMVAAIMSLALAKYVITRWEESSLIRNFAGTEAMALMITVLSAFGMAFLCAGLSSHQSGLGYTEFAASLGVIVLAAVGAVRLYRRAPVTSSALARPANHATI